MFLSIKDLSKKWNISERRIRKLCEEGRIIGSYKDGKSWKIPINIKKPTDKRISKNYNFKIIEEKLLILKSKRPLSSLELKSIYEEFLTLYTYNTNAIEGNTLTIKETELVLKGLTINQKTLNEHLEVIGIKEAFDYIKDLVTNSDYSVLNQNIIKNIHYLVLNTNKEEKGKYRKIQVYISKTSHIPPNPLLIEEKLNTIINEYNNSNENIIKKLAKFHVNFERIHPFIDGNGRTGRLIINLELMKNGYPPINIKFSDRLKYYKVFEEYEKTKKYTLMEKLIFEYLNYSLDVYLSIIN